eukprot:TRINITY_DN11_c0_g1_i2.p1 TRINITY_DN11_c0_g1~~TRINITY_DN11_c0_g1_i2.p1  ORF type:complete len:390 (-),score=46.49 TRINITY_DN11_c0_g1_i2:106-1275(-)
MFRFFLVLALSLASVSAGDDDLQNGPVTDPALITLLLRQHNQVRTQGQPPLVWNPALATIASNVANSNGAAGCRLKHSGTNCGENLAQDNIEVGRETLAEPFARSVKMWNDEATSACSGGGHYTQVIWASTLEVGCAFYKCSGDFYQPVVLACNYNPAGNFNGQNPCSGTSPSACVAFVSSGRGGPPTPSPVPLPPSPPKPPSPPTPSGCDDVPNSHFTFGSSVASCAQIKQWGWCSSVLTWGKQYCRTSCQGCTGSPSPLPSPPSPVPPSGCDDVPNKNFLYNGQTASCERVKAENWCSLIVQWGKEYCRTSCQNCKSALSSASESNSVTDISSSGTATSDPSSMPEGSTEVTVSFDSVPGWTIALLVLGSILLVQLVVLIVVMITRR